jgi:hypothetical protein
MHGMCVKKNFQVIYFLFNIIYELLSPIPCLWKAKQNVYTKQPVCLNIASTFLYPFFSTSTVLLTTTLFRFFPAHYRNVYFISHHNQSSYFQKLQINSFQIFYPTCPCLSVSLLLLFVFLALQRTVAVFLQPSSGL